MTKRGKGGGGVNTTALKATTGILRKHMAFSFDNMSDNRVQEENEVVSVLTVENWSEFISQFYT